jgi:stage II sporulation protein D
MVLVDGEPQDMSLGDYLTGVLLGEMPASFDLEALKAQTVAARTYTLRRLEQGDELSDDPAVCQAYVDPENAQEKLGEDWESLLLKLRQAVAETDGQVLTYEGELISATYFSSAGGRTESAQAVWGGEVPYLVSVESPEEPSSSTVSIDREIFLETLGITETGVSAVTYTEGGGVDTMVIGGKTVSGTELRSLFGLKSTQFTMELTEDTVEFLVQGNGHRVGLSQYGAEALAQEGKTYREILQWYYTGVEITEYR